ncbi:MAG TPA: carboxypeptidase regulatory-like domain-containing protein [Longimicrobium sp.]|jgi:hypothetical protein
MRTRFALLITVGLGLVLTAPAAAQRVQGVLVDAGGRPVAGAFVSLRGAGEAVVARALTGAEGRFSLQGSGAGTYRVRAERIGFATTSSAPLDLAAGETRDLRLVAASAGVALEGLVARGRSRCDVRPEAGAAAARVWEEARKALEATTWTAGALRFGYTEYERDVDPTSERVRAETAQRRTAVGRGVWVSRDAAELARAGYREERRDGIYFFAPDAKLLLSDEFQDSHCFGVAAGEGATRGLVGLTFQPVRRRGAPVDVSGVLWLDPASAELRHLDFNYTGLSQNEDQEGVGGRVEFVRLAGGAWIVRRWRLRMPVLVGKQWRMPTGGSGTHVVLDALRESGGYVGEVTSATGERLFAAQTGALEGTVVDAVTETPLAGARVTLVGTTRGAMSDEQGRFRVADLDEGRYAVTFTHPRTDSLRYRAPATDVAVRLGEAATVRLVSPSLATAIAAGCAGDSLRAGAGVLAGTVRNRANGAPLAGARVAVWWNGPSGTVRGEVESDAEGQYRFCGAPPGVRLSARASFLGRGGETTTLTIPGAEPVMRDLTTFVVSAAVQAGGEYLQATGVAAMSLEGRVVDAESGDPVAGARVRLGEGEEARTTDRRGAFSVRRVPHGTYRVQIEHPDYGLQTRWIALGGGATMDATFQIAKR